MLAVLPRVNARRAERCKKVLHLLLSGHANLLDGPEGCVEQSVWRSGWDREAAVRCVESPLPSLRRKPREESNMRTSNPALNQKSFQTADYGTGFVYDEATSHVMTIEGTAIKTGMLLALAIGAGAITWLAYANQSPLALPLMFGGMIIGLVFAIATIMKQTWAPVTAPLYAVAEGLFLGGVSAMYNAQFNGIVLQAIGLTMGTLIILLLAYLTGLIKASENFKAGVIAATGAICLVYFLSIALRLFGVGVPFIHDSGVFGMGFSLFVVAIAALNLVLDFDFIENAAEDGSPKYMEWYGAFGLMVTLVWLYLEILRMLAKSRSSGD
jgi:uncharacterized YccA/Bax inhibitor family protein